MRPGLQLDGCQNVNSESLSSTPTDVLYLGGTGRSGSTLLASIIGTVNGCYPVGELRGVWSAIETDELCGCGSPFSRCSFWRAIGDRAFSGWGSIDVQKMQIWDRKFLRQRRLPRLLSPVVGSSLRGELEAHLHVLAALYSAIRDVSRCQTIVDSSKVATYAVLLTRVPGLRVKILHLVRDSRAVSFSWGRTVDRPEYASHPTLAGTPMGTYSATVAALYCLGENSAFHALRARGISSERIRYEDLVGHPGLEVQRALGSVGLTRLGPDCPVDDQHYAAREFHTIGGSRIRFKRGPVEIREDAEWRTAMRRFDHLSVTILTLPLLLRYGYL